MVVRLLGELVATTQVGTRIPSERDLARDWGVARMTVRNAIGSLIKAGQLERRPGAGTFVVEAPYAKTLGLSSFTEDMRSRGHDPSNQLLEFAVQRYGADPIVRLGVDDDEPVYRFTRLRLADGQPIAVETNWIPVDVGTRPRRDGPRRVVVRPAQRPVWDHPRRGDEHDRRGASRHRRRRRRWGSASTARVCAFGCTTAISAAAR